MNINRFNQTLKVAAKGKNVSPIKRAFGSPVNIVFWESDCGVTKSCNKNRDGIIIKAFAKAANGWKLCRNYK